MLAETAATSNKPSNKRTINASSYPIETCNDYESVCHRNQILMKKLEVAKARLRSRVAYSPVMTQLDKLKKLYTEKLVEQIANKEDQMAADTTSTPTRLKKIYGPTFI